MTDITKSQYIIKRFHRVSRQFFSNGRTSMPKTRALSFFAYITGGSCLYTMNDGTQLVAKEGNVLFVSKGCHYNMDVTSDQFSYIVCTFSFDAEDVNLQHSVFCVKNPPAFEKLFLKMLGFFEGLTPHYMLDCLSLLYQIYSLLIQETQSTYIASSSKVRIENARNWFLLHLDDPALSIDEFAKVANLSKSHFRSLFKNIYNITPIEYITQERIACAKQLLAIPELSLEEVALQSGFSSLSYFCKVFKANVDTTPGLYRRKLLEQK